MKDFTIKFPPVTPEQANKIYFMAIHQFLLAVNAGDEEKCIYFTNMKQYYRQFL